MRGTDSRSCHLTRLHIADMDVCASVSSPASGELLWKFCFDAGVVEVGVHVFPSFTSSSLPECCTVANFSCDGRVCLPDNACLASRLFSKLCTDAGDKRVAFTSFLGWTPFMLSGSRTFLYILANNAAASGRLPDWFSRPIGRSEGLLYLKLVCSFSSKATAVKCFVD